MDNSSFTIFLKPVDKQNYEAVCDLDVSKAQQDYVACNMWSLVESMYHTGYVTRAIYADDVPVGFFMWVHESPGKVSIWRFMVDECHQQKGIGRIALSLAIQEIKQTPNLEEIEICYHPDNPVAKDFYSQFGFVEMGTDEDDEDMLAIIRV